MMFNKVWSLAWVVVFSMLLATSILEKDLMWIILNSIILLLNSVSLITAKSE